MDTRLRILKPEPTRTTSRHRDNTAAFWCGVIAIVSQLVFSSNVLKTMGYEYNLHPSTFFIVICAIFFVGVRGAPLSQRFRETPGLLLFVCGMPALTLYAIFFVGYSGSTVFIETFWSAGLLALMIEPATDRQKRLLGGILMTIVIANVFIALYESLSHTQLFPLFIDPDAPDAATNDMDDEFRAHAFFSHPLSAALVAAMAVFLLYSSRLRFIPSASIFALLMVGLLAFGGRTALGVTLLVSAATAAYTLVTGVVKRKLSLEFMLYVVTAAIVMPIVFYVVISQTTIADRIVNNLYYDGSAAVRATQWEIFNHLQLRHWLFGISKDELFVLKYQIGLGGADTDIENFWILLFLDLGSIGFTVFLALFVGFIIHLARYAGTLNGWLLAGSAFIIDSSSNSLGVWSNDLLLEVAFLVAISGYRNYSPARSFRRLSITRPVLRQVFGRSGGLMARPGPSRMPNLR